MKEMSKFCEYNKILHEYFNNPSSEKLCEIEGTDLYQSALGQCGSNFNGRFSKSFIEAKRNIANLLSIQIINLNETEIQRLCNLLSPINLSTQKFLNDGVLLLYFGLVNLVQKSESSLLNQKQQLNKAFCVLLKQIIIKLNPLLYYFFVNRNFSKYTTQSDSQRKLEAERRSKLGSDQILSQRSQSSQKQIQICEQNQEQIYQRIQNGFQDMPISVLVQNYLKEQQNEIVELTQICRICQKKVQLKMFEKHLKLCTKKAKMQIQLREVQEERKILFDELQNYEKEIIKQNQTISDRQSEILKIITLIKNNYQTFRNGKKGRKRNNTQFNLFKKQPSELINELIKTFQTKYQKFNLLELIQKNSQKNQDIKRKLENFELSGKFQIISSKEQIGSFESLQQSINNAVNQTNQFKTKKSIFATKKRKRRPSKIGSLQSIFTGSSQSITSHISSQSSSNQIKSQKSIKIPVQKGSKIDKMFTSIGKFKSLVHLQNFGFMSMKSVGCSMDDLEEQKMGLDDFEILKFLGKGAFGKVYLVRRKATGDLYALKHIEPEHTQTNKQIQLIKNEHQIFKKIAGDHLIRAPFAFTTQIGHFFVLQFMPGGDLSQILAEEVYLEQEHARFYLAEIILALEHLHTCQIIHRDLKPQNIVIDRTGHIKLTDFGLSQIKIQRKIAQTKFANQKDVKVRAQRRRAALVNKKDNTKIIGTPDYIAPQIINQTSINNMSIDWWSLGVMAYQMLVGCRPFSAMTADQVLNNIVECKVEWPEIGQEEGMVSPEAYDLIVKLLDSNFQKRLGSQSVLQIKNHPFFKEVDWNNIKKQRPPIISHKKMCEKQEYQQIAQDRALRQQIEQAGSKSNIKTKKSIGLENFVRYDILLEETCKFVQAKINKEKTKIQRLRSIGSFIESNQSCKQNLLTYSQQIPKKHLPCKMVSFDSDRIIQ